MKAASEKEMARREPRRLQVDAAKNTVLPQWTLRGLRSSEIKSLCAEIAREFHPDRIVLFGSYAYGKPRPWSDLDLLVVMPFTGSPFRQAGIILGHVVRAVGVVPLDLIVRTAQEVDERIQMGDSFMRDIIEHGRVMYEADHS